MSVGRRHRLVRQVRNRAKRVGWIRRLAGKEPLAGSRAARRGGGGLAVLPGRPLEGDGVAGLPVALFSMLGSDQAEVDAAIEWVARAQALTRSFVPLFVVDVDDFGVLRRHRYLFEYLPRESDVEALDMASEWPDFVAGRLADIVRRYGPDVVLAVPPGRPLGESPEVQATLRALSPR